MNTKAEYYGDLTKVLIKRGSVKGARSSGRAAARAALAQLRDQGKRYSALVARLNSGDVLTNHLVLDNPFIGARNLFKCPGVVSVAIYGA